MKGKSHSIISVVVALAIVLSLVIVMAVPALANVTAAGVALSSYEPAVAATYTINFNVGAAGALAATVDTITVVFPAGTTIPAAPTAADVTVNATAAATVAFTPATQTAVITTPVAVANNGAVALVFGGTAKPTNPATAGAKTLTVATSIEPIAVPSGAYTILAQPAVVVSPTTAGKVAQYSITFNTDNGTTFTAGASTFTVTFPVGTTVPTTIAKGNITIQDTTAVGAPAGNPATDAVVSGRGVTVQVPSLTFVGGAFPNIAANDQVVITFAQTAGVVNPNIAKATYNLTVAGAPSAGTQATVTSANYTIARSVSASPTSGTRGTAVAISGVGFAATTSLTLTLGGNILGQTTTDANGTFSATITATVPPFAGGVNVITATDGAGNATNVNFTINPIIAAVSPTQATSGSVVNITVKDFNAGDTINANSITIGGIAGTNAATVLAAGSGTIAFTLPVVLTPGSQTIVVTENSAAARNASTTFTVLGRTLTLIPSSGPVGTKVSVQGSNFNPGGNVPIGNITFSGGAWNAAAVAIDTSGAFVVPLTVSGAGIEALPTNIALIVQVTDNAGLIGTATFTISPRSITINPTTSGRGSTVQISGSNFRVSGSVNVTYGGTQVGTYSTGSDGSFSGTFTVPSAAAIGSSNTVAAVDTTNAGVTATATHNVPNATISVNPTSAGPGQNVTITGVSFPAYSTLAAVTIGGLAIAPPIANSDGLGNWTATILVPQMPAGPAAITATLGAQTATVAFTVVTAPVAPATALAGIAGNYTAVWGYDPVAGWQSYAPGAPAAANNLATLVKGKGYWINATSAVTLVYGQGIYNLSVGWNLIGWLG